MSTAQQVIDRVKEAVEDPNDKFFETQDYVRVYNDALDEISELAEINESYVYVKRRKWALYTDLRGILPPTFLRVTSIFNPGSGKWLDPTTVREMDASVGRDWESRVDETRWWFMRGLWHLGTYPISGDDVSPLKVWYVSLLPHIAEDGGMVNGLSSTPNIPQDYNVAIEDYMIYALLAERKETDKSLEYFRKFNDKIVGLKDMAENRMRRDRTPKMGARR
jgi:hypothetical protein